MNRAYRIVWSAARQAWIVASEKAGSGGRPPLAVKKVAGALLLLGVAGAAAAATYSGTQVNDGDVLLIQNDESAKYTSVMSGGSMAVNSGGSAYSTVVSSGGLFLAADGSFASKLQINAGGIFQASTGANVDGDNANGAFSVSGGNAKYVLLDNAGLLGVNSGDSSFATVVNSGGTETVYGTASGTTVNAGGIQGINQGGTAEGTVVNSGGTQEVAGMTSGTILTSGGLQIIQNAGSAYDTLADTGSEQDVISGGTVQSVLMSGTQNVWGKAIDTTVYAGGRQDVWQGGQAVQTTVAQDGVAIIQNGGFASLAVAGSGGTIAVASGGVISDGGGSYGVAVADRGLLLATDGAVINDAQLASGAILQTTTGAAITGMNALGRFSILDGQAQNVLLDNGGLLNVNAGDSSTGTVVNSGGLESVMGSADGTTVNAGGTQYVSRGGIATGTLVNSGGSLFVDGATTSAQVSSGGIQVINSGGQAALTTVNTGGALLVLNGGTASRATINSGGLLAVSSGGTASNTTVATGGLLDIADGGILTLAGNSFSNNGITTWDTTTTASLNTNLTGSGQLTKNGTGLLTLGGTLSQSQVNLNAGSLVMDGLQAFTNIIAQAGTTLSLINSATLTGIIDPTDVNIDSSSTWNITGDSLVDTLTNTGSIVFVPSQGAFTPHTLTATNLIGNGGTITLNTVAGDSSSPVDKVIIDGGRASGRTGLRVLNRGGLGAQTTGNGIAVIQAINGATTDSGAFSMTQPLAAGAYSYSLYRNADQSWYLTSQQTAQSGPASNDTVPAGPVNYRDGMWSYAAMPSLSMDYDRLVAGTADTRFHYAPDSRVWGRVAAGQLRHPDSGSLTGGSVPESSSAYSFFQLGGDLWQLDGANADWRAGIFGATGLMRSDVWRDGGSADAGTDRDTVYTGGAYVSGRSHAGLHIDGLLQASRHNLKAASNDDTRLSTHGTGWLASAEVGQAFSVSPALALEPQLQYQVQGLSLNDGQDEAASLSWSDSRRQSVRAGLKLGTAQDAKATLAWWVTPSVTQSYGGHSGFTASAPGVAGSEASFRSNLSGTSVGLNGGVNARIRQNVTLGVQGGWSESLHGGEAGGYYGLVNLGVSFR
ncbi:AIDA repeat-containing protein [Pantoea stewartii]|uniref:AIDA repeat-containing protein n=1 Tax=Pantoea stewartii TaxID=66269 RepID=UPI003242F211